MSTVEFEGHRRLSYTTDSSADLHTNGDVRTVTAKSRQNYDAKQGHIGKHRVFRTNWPIN